MHQLGEIRMPNLYGRKRKDANKGHRPRKYNTAYDETGRVGKENPAIKSFWRENKMEDIIQLSPEQLDARIEISLEGYKKRQLDDNPMWWYPELGKKTFSEARSNKKIDKEPY